MKESEMRCNPIKFCMINYSICASQRLLSSMAYFFNGLSFFLGGGGAFSFLAFLLHSLFFNVEALIE